MQTNFSTEVQALIYQIRKAIFQKNDFFDAFAKYVDLTGDDSHTHIIPYLPEECTSVARIRENAAVMVAVSRAAKTLRGIRSEKPSDNLGVAGVQSIGDGNRSNIVVDASDKPKAKLVVDYSDKPLQGAYMGRKPVVGATRRKRFPVKYVITSV